MSVYTKELKREMGILEIMQCNGKILETRLDFVLAFCFLFCFLMVRTVKFQITRFLFHLFL